MRQLQPVIWTKGVLLTPQHLQTQDRYFEDLLRFQLSALTYAPWGVHRLEVDREALATGQFALAAATGIFPDGLLYDAPSADPLPAPRLLEPCWRPDQQSLDVYLAVPERRPGSYQVSSSADDRPTRYVIDVLYQRDETDGRAEKPIQIARKNVRLVAQGESLEGSAACRIARVRRGAGGEYVLDPQCVPPLLDIGASEMVLAIVRRLVELLAARSTALSGSRRQRNQGLAEFGAADVAQFWLLHTINTHLPVLRHLLETRRGHPEHLYDALLTLAGALSTFSSTHSPLTLPAYDHDDPGPPFAALDLRLRELLATSLPVNCVSLPLREVSQLKYAAALDDDRLLTAPALYLAVAAGVPRAELLRRVPQLVKMCSSDHLEHLISHALPGITLTHTPTPPSAVPVRLDYEYFALSKTGIAWEAVTRARNIAAYVPADLPSPRLELVVVLARQG